MADPSKPGLPSGLGDGWGGLGNTSQVQQNPFGNTAFSAGGIWGAPGAGQASSGSRLSGYTGGQAPLYQPQQQIGGFGSFMQVPGGQGWQSAAPSHAGQQHPGFHEQQGHAPWPMGQRAPPPPQVQHAPQQPPGHLHAPPTIHHVRAPQTSGALPPGLLGPRPNIEQGGAKDGEMPVMLQQLFMAARGAQSQAAQAPTPPPAENVYKKAQGKPEYEDPWALPQQQPERQTPKDAATIQQILTSMAGQKIDTGAELAPAEAKTKGEEKGVANDDAEKDPAKEGAAEGEDGDTKTPGKGKPRGQPRGRAAMAKAKLEAMGELDEEELQGRGSKDTPMKRERINKHADPAAVMKLTEDMKALLVDVEPTQDELAHRLALARRIEMIFRKEWPDASLHVFGSSANMFGCKNSDLDLCLVRTDGSHIDPAEHGEMVNRMAELLEEAEMEEILPLSKARVPIVKFVEPTMKIQCDVCIQNTLALRNTMLLRTYAMIDPRVRELAYTLKHWAKMRHINNPYRGTLSSYAYVLMAIHFLQMRHPPIIPCLQTMSDAKHPKVPLESDGFDTYFYSDIGGIRRMWQQRNTETCGQLLVQFFKFFARQFDWRRSVICIRKAQFISKEEKEWTINNGRDHNLLCIEDPFNLNHNLGRVVDKYTLEDVKEEIWRAHRLLNNGGTLDALVKEFDDENEIMNFVKTPNDKKKGGKSRTPAKDGDKANANEVEGE